MKKKRIGYTTGVFDMFHIGHLNILKKAKAECDYLIVGVSTDELVQSYKGKIPIIPYEERKKILESIKFVDKVIPQKDRDKFKAWSEENFNIMFVGDDWKNNEMFQRMESEFKEIDVEIKYFPYTKSTSSTILREKLLSNK